MLLLVESDTFEGVTGSAEFLANIKANTILHLTSPYDNGDASEIYTDISTKRSDKKSLSNYLTVAETVIPCNLQTLTYVCGILI